jgi:hypothetical protein
VQHVPITVPCFLVIVGVFLFGLFGEGGGIERHIQRGRKLDLGVYLAGRTFIRRFVLKSLQKVVVTLSEEPELHLTAYL